MLGKLSCKAYSLLFCILVSSCLVAKMAWAHASLVRTTPPANAVLTEAPMEVQLRFSEPIERRFSRIEIYYAMRDPATGAIQPGERVDEGWVPGARLARDLAVRLPAQLRPGFYLVQWAVLSVDSHRVSGSFTFSYSPATAPPSPANSGKPNPTQ